MGLVGIINNKFGNHCKDVRFMFSTETGKRVLQYWVSEVLLNDAEGGKLDSLHLAHTAGQRSLIKGMLTIVGLPPEEVNDMIDSAIDDLGEHDYE